MSNIIKINTRTVFKQFVRAFGGYQIILVISFFSVAASNYVLVNNNISDAAKVINITTRVRGETQRKVKLALGGRNVDKSINRIEENLNALRYGSTSLGIKRLDDEFFQSKIIELNNRWVELNKSVNEYKKDKSKLDELLEQSELFWRISDAAVDDAQRIIKEQQQRVYIMQVGILVGNVIILILFGFILRNLISSMESSNNALTGRSLTDKEIEEKLP